MQLFFNVYETGADKVILHVILHLDLYVKPL